MMCVTITHLQRFKTQMSVSRSPRIPPTVRDKVGAREKYSSRVTDRTPESTIHDGPGFTFILGTQDLGVILSPKITSHMRTRGRVRRSIDLMCNGNEAVGTHEISTLEAMER